MNVSQPHEFQDESTDVKRALAQLSPFERTCLLLHLHGDFTQSEIAEIMEAPEERVQTALDRAHQEVHLVYPFLLAQKEMIPPGIPSHTLRPWAEGDEVAEANTRPAVLARAIKAEHDNRTTTPLVRRLAEWSEGHITQASQGHLLSVLEQAMPLHSAVRQAIRGHKPRRVTALLATARTQVSLFGLGFWLVSALVTLLGAAVVLSKMALDQEVVLRASGPLLAYLGAIAAFRGRGARVLELELVCLPSPLQLAIARLVIVLGYDVSLSLALSLALWAGGAGQVLILTLTFLMPLLLVTGLALLLSLRLPVQAAASLAYGSWLAFLVISSATNLQALLLTPTLLVLPGGIGLALLAMALLRIRTDMHHLLPHP